jgi:hypothetical protein
MLSRKLGEGLDKPDKARQAEEKEKIVEPKRGARNT